MLDTLIPALRAFLLADSQIAARVGTRIYPVKLPQNVTYPAIQIQSVSDVGVPVIAGASSATIVRAQVDYWTSEQDSPTAFLDGQAGAALVRARMGAFAGHLEDTRTSPPLAIRVALRFLDKTDVYEPDVNGGFYSARAEYQAFHGLTGAAA